MNKLAYFRFEASPTIGAGHAIRSCVIADALKKIGWECKIATSKESYDFIQELNRFTRVEPALFFEEPKKCELLVVDNYDLGEKYHQHFRASAQKIMVISDQPNRKHDCDILVDQTYGRSPDEYAKCVNANCNVLTGSDYVLLRPEFTALRMKALAKRKKTREINRILVSMGGGEQKTHTVKVINDLERVGFHDHIDIVLGFSGSSRKLIVEKLKHKKFSYELHVNPNIAELMFDSDLVIGASGSSVWERASLFLLQYIIKTAENQSDIFKLFPSYNIHNLPFNELINYFDFLPDIRIDGLGLYRVLSMLGIHTDKLSSTLTHRRVNEGDIEQLFEWQQLQQIRQYAINSVLPKYDEHVRWCRQKIHSPKTVFEMFYLENRPCGTLRLDYREEDSSYIISWYVVPLYQGRGIGTKMLEIGKCLAGNNRLIGFVLNENLPSHKAFKKARFKLMIRSSKGGWYVS